MIMIGGRLMKLFKNTKASRGIRLTAIALAMVVLVSGTVILQGHSSAAAEDNKVIVTSPFTAAVAEVKDSVVGVRNYQVVRYSNNGYGSFGDWGNFFGFGNWGNGYGYGDGYGNNYGDQNRSEEVLAGTGSGVVIADHYVLTNFHVVEKATSLKVTVAKDDVDEPDLYSAVVVASDENLDIAVIYAPDLDLKPVQLGDSDTLQVGDWAICIGNPLAERFYGTVTAGIVSALNRSVNNTSYDKYGHKDVTTNTMIQVDAAINNGNSGGGMFSVTGELMGIPTLKYSGTAYAGADIDGIGMCIPINAAKPLINDVLSGKIETPEVTDDGTTASSNAQDNNLTGKPRLGVKITSINTNSQAVLSGIIPNGVYVKEVESGTPAEKAGMLAGDIIVDVDGTVITSVSQITSVLTGHQEGDTLHVKVFRVPGMADIAENGTQEIPDNGEYIDLDVTLAVVDAVAQ